jgi:hypothetical protein
MKRNSIFNNKRSVINKGLLIFFLGVLISTTACKEKIDIELKSTYVRLVVEGEITNEAKKHTIKITETSNYFSNEPQPKVSGAIVTINNGSNTVTLTETSPGIYQTDSTYQGEVGKIYTLNIKYNGEEYTASSMLKYVAPIDSISFAKDPFFPDQDVVNLWAQEPPSTGDYYSWLYYINGKLESDTLSEIMYASDEMVNGNYMNGFSIYMMENTVPGDTITLEMKSINKEYYDFINAVFSEVYGAGTPFSGPPSNVKSNIKNVTNSYKDVMGFFIASAVSRKSGILN